MALLSIAEPGQSKARLQHSKHKPALGIDLGTTNSLVATAKEGKVIVLPDQTGNTRLSSIVTYFSDGTNSVGDCDAEQLNKKIHTRISSVKRLMGKALTDISYKPGYKLIEPESGGMVEIQTVAGKRSPVQVSAAILQFLSKRGFEYLSDEPEGVVITVPAYFDDGQRQATKDAARLAGLNVLRLLSEPTAAAVAYGLDKKLNGTVLIYDLGGGTFDVSLMRLEQGVFQVVATGGDAALGGDDLDRAIMKWVQDNAGVNVQSDSELVQLQQLARETKHALSKTNRAIVRWGSWQAELSQKQFHTLIDPYIQRTLKLCKRVLRDAEVTIDELTDVILVGGSTRSPRIQELVEQWYGSKPLSSIDPESVVAMGAALQADVLAGNKYGEEMLLLDVVPLSLGIETMGNLVEKIIPRNTAIPAARAQEFTTYRDGQTVMSLHVLQGERELVQDCRSLGRFELRGIPPMVAGAARIRVTFQVDADGLVEVRAEELTSGVQSTITLKPSYGLKEGQIETMLRDSYASAQQDLVYRKLAEARVEAARHIEALRSALLVDGELLLSKDECAELNALISELDKVATGTNADAIIKLTDNLNNASQTFATRRMDKGIRSALTGHSLDELT